MPVPASRSASRAAGILVLAALVGCSAAPAPPADVDAGPISTQRATPTPTTLPLAAGSAYLALGDSITFGLGVPRPQRNGYVARVADSLADGTPPISETRVFAIPGETAADFLDRRLDDVIRAIDELGPRVALVTIGLGANELLQTRRSPQCRDRASEACTALVTGATMRAEASLDAIVSGVQHALERAGATEARILLLADYNPEAGDLVASSMAGADGVVACDPGDAGPGLDDRIACVAEARGVGLVDLYAAFLGRELELTRIGRGDVHPNAEGYSTIAETIVAAVEGG